MKGALGMNYQSIGGDKDSSDNIVGFTVNSQVGYRWNRWEVNLASYVTFGKFSNIHFLVTDQLDAVATGPVRTINFIPLLKFFTNWLPIPNRNFYLAAGPSVSQRTFWPREYHVEVGNLGEDYKINYLDYGGFAAIGIEEISTFKEENPSYLEIIFGLTQSRKITVVDASNNKKVRVVHDDEAGPNIKTFVLMLNLGVTFF